MPDDVYERILERIKGKDVRIVVDATKKLLLNALKYKPFLIKPNRQELSEMFGVEINTEDDIEKYGWEDTKEYYQKRLAYIFKALNESYDLELTKEKQAFCFRVARRCLSSEYIQRTDTYA